MSTDYYDLNMLYEQVGNDNESLKRFIEIFLVSVPEDMQSLDTAIQTGDFDKSRASSHKMKSSFLIMGADWAKDLCMEIEAMSKERRETEKLPVLYKELSDKFIIMSGLLQPFIS